MPFYEYQCCRLRAPPRRTPEDHRPGRCGSARPAARASLRRLVSAPVFRLKGGGWYETDFKADKEEQRNIAGDKEPAAGEAPAADKPEEAKDTAKRRAQTKKADPEPRPAAPNKRRRAARRKAAGRRPPEARPRASTALQETTRYLYVGAVLALLAAGLVVRCWGVLLYRSISGRTKPGGRLCSIRRDHAVRLQTRRLHVVVPRVARIGQPELMLRLPSLVAGGAASSACS